MGCRDGSNMLGQFLHLSGCMLPPETKEGDDWNTFWVEDWHTLTHTTMLLGVEQHFHVQRHMRPETLSPYPLKWFKAHFEKMADKASATGQPYLAKFSTLPYVWPEFSKMLPEPIYTHELVDIRRNRAERVKSLLRLHPGRTEAQANEFFDRSDAGRNRLIEKFRASGRTVVAAGFDAIRENPALLNNVALSLGLTPTTQQVFDTRKIRA